jgi:hypothetical protein
MSDYGYIDKIKPRGEPPFRHYCRFCGEGHNNDKKFEKHLEGCAAKRERLESEVKLAEQHHEFPTRTPHWMEKIIQKHQNRRAREIINKFDSQVQAQDEPKRDAQ